jgi:hypothetical protein
MRTWGPRAGRVVNGVSVARRSCDTSVFGSGRSALLQVEPSPRRDVLSCLIGDPISGKTEAEPGMLREVEVIASARLTQQAAVTLQRSPPPHSPSGVCCMRDSALARSPRCWNYHPLERLKSAAGGTYGLRRQSAACVATCSARSNPSDVQGRISAVFSRAIRAVLSGAI